MLKSKANFYQIKEEPDSNFELSQERHLKKKKNFHIDLPTDPNLVKRDYIFKMLRILFF
jgi:hypothetical protein